MNPMQLQQLSDSIGLAIKQSRDALNAVQSMNNGYGSLRGEIAQVAGSVATLDGIVKRMSAARSGGDPGIQRVENIPGRRIPFFYLVDIPIGLGVTSVQQGTITISQEGPFVAVAQVASFLSAFSFQYRDPETGAVSTFSGRSFGRQRPVHSVWDMNDGQPVISVTQAQAFPGTGAPHVISPANLSPFRTMEADFRIMFENQGSSFPRTNIEVPSSMWVKGLSDPNPLPALDVFERGEVLTFKVLPLHPNNPAFGNISGFGAPNPNFPFLDSGWDAIEGINDQNDAAAADQDPVTRAQNGVLTIGFWGYRIVQPAGAGPY